MNLRKLLVAGFRSGWVMLILGILFLSRSAMLGLRISVPRDVRTIAVSQNGAKAAGSFADGMVRMWDLPTRKCIQEFPVASSEFFTFRFDPTGNYLAVCTPITPLSGSIPASKKDAAAVGSEDRTHSARLTVASATRSILKQKDFETLPITLFAPDGKRLCVYANAQPSIWNLESNEIVALKSSSRNANYCAFSSDSKFLASGSDDGEITLFSLDTNKSIQVWNAHVGSIQGLNFSRDGSLLASCGVDGSVKVWRTSDQTLVKELPDHKEMVGQVLFSPKGSLLASAGMNGVVILWNTSDWKMVHRWPRLQGIREWRFLDSDQTLILLDHGMQIHFWEADANGREVASIPTSMTELADRLSFSQDLSRLAYADGPLVIVDSKTGEKLSSAGTAKSNHAENAYFDVRFAGDNLVACTAKEVQLLNATTLETLATFRRHDGSSSWVIAGVIIGLCALLLGIVQIRNHPRPVATSPESAKPEPPNELP